MNSVYLNLQLDFFLLFFLFLYLYPLDGIIFFYK